MKKPKQQATGRTPVLMAKEYWADSSLSIARYMGRVKCFGVEYVIVDKRGHDIFECSTEAELEGREVAIEPGVPADLVDTRYVEIYRKVGREKFIELLKNDTNLERMRKEAGL